MKVDHFKSRFLKRPLDDYNTMLGQFFFFFEPSYRILILASAGKRGFYISAQSTSYLAVSFNIVSTTYLVPSPLHPGNLLH